MHGREARLPIEQGIPKICTDGWQPTMKSYIKDLLDRMANVRKEMIRNRTIYQMKMVQQHDKNVVQPLQQGDQVLRAVPQQFRPKMGMPREGPWQVEEQRVKEDKPLPVYKIRNEEGKSILIHRESLYPFEEPAFIDNKPQPVVVKDQPKRERKPKTVESHDGPAMRTRSRKNIILALLTVDENWANQAGQPTDSFQNDQINPTDGPTDDPTNDPTDDSTDDPTNNPTDDPMDDPTDDTIDDLPHDSTDGRNQSTTGNEMSDQSGASSEFVTPQSRDGSTSAAPQASGSSLNAARAILSSAESDWDEVFTQERVLTPAEHPFHVPDPPRHVTDASESDDGCIIEEVSEQNNQLRRSKRPTRCVNCFGY